MMMLVYMYKRHSQTLIVKHFTSLNNLCLTTTFFRSYITEKSIPTNVDSSDFKISFLKNKCGLSGKPLVYASNYLDFDSSNQRPQEVLDLFLTSGFPRSTITKIVSACPRILKEFHPTKFLKPKLDFLLSITQSQAEVAAIVARTPRILCRSLTNHLIPSFNLINSVTGSSQNTISVLKYNPYILMGNLTPYFLLNNQLLLTLGVPHSQILKLLRTYGHVLATPHNKFRNIVLKATDMGFDLKSSYFLHAVRTFAYVNNSAWESRCVLFKSFGFSDHEILSMFKKLPQIMCYSDKAINEKMGFFLKKLQWTLSRLSTYPAVLAYSLEKRIIPRCSVLQVLASKNITYERYILTLFIMAEKKFIEDFVHAYKDEVPEVMEAYKGKLRFKEYTFEQK